LARHLLNVPLLLVALALGASACGRKSQGSARPDASAALPGPLASLAQDFSEKARQTQFTAELARARARFQSKPTLGDCTATLREPADQELCRAAAGALVALEQDPAAGPERTLSVLAEGALALVRFSERVRYLTLLQARAQRPNPGGSASPQGDAPKALGSARKPPSLRREFQAAFELGDGPLERLMANTVHLERDVLRNLGAYLEYAELPVRRAAFETVKQLRNEHPQWPLLDAELREAALLETDPDLKRQITDFSASGLPRKRLGQSPDSR